MYVYIYIYIYIERERDVDRLNTRPRRRRRCPGRRRRPGPPPPRSPGPPAPARRSLGCTRAVAHKPDLLLRLSLLRFLEERAGRGAEAPGPLRGSGASPGGAPCIV